MSSNSLDRKHERFVFSAALALRKYVKDLKKIVLEGEAPEASGIAGSPAPLPREEAEKLIGRLSEVEKIVDEFIEKFNPGVRSEPSLSLTYIWISIMLGKMEGIVESMEPRSLSKTRGEMPRDLETYLDKQVKNLLSIIRDLRSTYTTAKRKTQSLE
ncbi:MAG: hypothetical protein HA496_10595 [Thaumarchaeota archaeon]|nr:hypothetical protein [Nitrososphaerota archaeon]